MKDPVVELSGWKIEKRIEQSKNAIESAMAFKPEMDSFGVFSYNDGPGYAGGGMGAFLWFEDKERALGFVQTELVFQDGAYHEASIVVAVRKIVEEHKNGLLDSDATIQKINDVLKTFSQVSWWGTHRSLLSDSGDFPCKVRGDFREHYLEDGENKGPILAEELGDFLHYIIEYGF